MESKLKVQCMDSVGEVCATKPAKQTIVADMRPVHQPRTALQQIFDTLLCRKFPAPGTPLTDLEMWDRNWAVIKTITYRE